MTKTCTKCGGTKPLDEYHKNRGKKDGHEYNCKRCRREVQQAYREDNRGRIRKRDRAYHASTREYQDRRGARKSREAGELTRLTATRTGKPWEQWEDYFIVAHPEMTAYQIATHIGRTHAGVAYRRPLLEKSAASG